MLVYIDLHILQYYLFNIPIRSQTSHCRSFFYSLENGFLTSILLTFWARSFFVVEDFFPVYCRVFSSIPGFYLPDVNIPFPQL